MCQLKSRYDLGQTLKRGGINTVNGTQTTTANTDINKQFNKSAQFRLNLKKSTQYHKNYFTKNMDSTIEGSASPLKRIYKMSDHVRSLVSISSMPIKIRRCKQPIDKY